MTQLLNLLTLLCFVSYFVLTSPKCDVAIHYVIHFLLNSIRFHYFKKIYSPTICKLSMGKILNLSLFEVNNG